MRVTRALVPFVVGVATITTAFYLRKSPAAPDAEPEASLTQGAAVQVQARALGRGWHDGSVGAVGPCVAIMVPFNREGEGVIAYKPVFIDSATHIRVPAGAVARSDSARLSAPWRILPIAAVRRAYGGCEL
jgi:hypothetical protein